jgi:acyl-CoA thioester hydrolase
MTNRSDYRFFLSVPTRWMDNDVYGHVNNVVYYSYFDTIINRYLIEVGGLDIHQGHILGLCVESHCSYHRPVSFPDTLEAGLRVAHLGRSSVRYEVGIFSSGTNESCADGYFVHVFVGRESRRPHPVDGKLRLALENLLPG